jgi:hypothetical protein
MIWSWVVSCAKAYRAAMPLVWLASLFSWLPDRLSGSTPQHHLRQRPRDELRQTEGEHDGEEHIANFDESGVGMRKESDVVAHEQSG